METYFILPFHDGDAASRTCAKTQSTHRQTPLGHMQHARMLFWHSMQRHHGAELAESTGCTPKKNSLTADSTDHMLIRMNISWALTKRFSFFLFQALALYYSYCKCISEFKCAHGFCWKEGNHWRPAVYHRNRLEEHEHSVWPASPAREHGDMRIKSMLTYGMGRMFWMPTETGVLVANNVTTLCRNGSTTMATMEAHSISVATQRKANGLEINL
jgi:hypothetical protein